jgi:glycine/D-amino acid oxidase-like deaminating enzyme
LYDAIVIGGGFFGASVAIHLASKPREKRVLVIEREPVLLARASWVNQARIHGGYHYPRSFTTAYRSRANYSRFLADYAAAVYSSFTQLYAIAARNSKVTPRQFERFCKELGAPLRQPPRELTRLFSPVSIAAVYAVEETAFDAAALRELLMTRLADANVDVRCGAAVNAVRTAADGHEVDWISDGAPGSGYARAVINCTYSGLAAVAPTLEIPPGLLKHEIAEVALIEPPVELVDAGITVMDGTFFSSMPFPARRLHSLTHVRYTPHRAVFDDPEQSPPMLLAVDPQDSRAERMRLDAARYVPVLRNARIIESLFEVKTVLVHNEGDDGRPILFLRHAGLPAAFSVLGGKLDNIYDALERLDAELVS